MRLVSFRRGWRLLGLAGTIFVYVAGILLLSIISLQNSNQRRPRSFKDVSGQYNYLHSEFNHQFPLTFSIARSTEPSSSGDVNSLGAHHFKLVPSLDLHRWQTDEQSISCCPYKTDANISGTFCGTQVNSCCWCSR